MPIRKANKLKICICLIMLLNILALIYFASFQHGHDNWSVEEHRITDIADEVTIIIREFEDFENRIAETVDNLRMISQRLAVIIISDDIPYPPLAVKQSETVHFVKTHVGPDQQNMNIFLQKIIKTPFILFLPDNVRISDSESLVKMIKDLKNRKFTKILAARTRKESLYCNVMDVDLKTWTLYINTLDGGEGMCDSIDSEHAILLRTSNMFELSNPFARPLHISLYLQFILRRWKTSIYSEQVFKQIGADLFKNYKNEWKHKRSEEDRLKNTMVSFDIKQIVYDRTKVINFGCTKETERCFQTVIGDMPDFLSKGKWTPPCCLTAVRNTAKHVFSVLEKCSVRYWLEGGSLLGAARNGDIIPWDYDVDIGIYKSDIEKCDYLKKITKDKPHIDEEEFYWENAIEGNFFRVHYSDINRNHVDIFPFYSRSGTMTKDTWFKTHKQDTEFPEHYLNPLIKIKFMGMNVSAPNNVRDFLEFKFGPGVIEQPRYPNDEHVFKGDPHK